MIGRGAMTTPAAWIPAWRESPSSRSAIRTTLRDRLVRRHRLLQARRLAERALEVDVGAVRHELGDAVAERHRQRQHARHVAHRELRLQLRERHDLRHVLAPVLLRHVLDDLAAARLAEVDVDVGHRDALGVQEPLEEQVVLAAGRSR